MADIRKFGDKVLNSKHGNKKITFDLRFIPSQKPVPLVIFLHGFKGFKDWGHFNLMADEFAQQGFAVLKMNFSHNGTSPSHPIDFIDLEAFGNNNFSIELDDVDVVIEHLFSTNEEWIQNIDLSQLFIIGHSKGGATALIKGLEDSRIKAVGTLASVLFVKERYSQDLEDWKEKGVKFIWNGRTEQNMPLYFQLAEDVLKNSDRFNLPHLLQDYPKPALLVHGTADEAVAFSETDLIKEDNPSVKVVAIEGANHTFGGKHPYDINALPHDSKTAVHLLSDFFHDHVIKNP